MMEIRDYNPNEEAMRERREKANELLALLDNAIEDEGQAEVPEESAFNIDPGIFLDGIKEFLRVEKDADADTLRNLLERIGKQEGEERAEEGAFNVGLEAIRNMFSDYLKKKYQ